MSNKQAPEDVAAFKRIIESDPENKKCFECQYPHPLWCNINHGVFICMECSGVHRGLGVHLSFVRSATIDDWTAWRPEKLKQMEIGGNRKARLFFERHGVPKQPIRARYEHNGALMYKDKLEAEALGKPFSEASWKVPEWKERMLNANNNCSPNVAANGDRFQGMGSGGGMNKPSSAGGDWLGVIAEGWGKVASATNEIATATTKSVKEADIQTKAAESATWAWGNLTSYATTLTKLAAEATQAVTKGNLVGEEDGLGALTKNVERTNANTDDDRFKGIEHRGAPLRPPNTSDEDDGLSALVRNVKKDDVSLGADNERYKGFEHKAVKTKTDDGWGGGFDDDDGWGESKKTLRDLTDNLPKTNRFQGVGSSPNTATSARASPNATTGSVTVSSTKPAPKKDGWDDWDNNDDFE